MKRFTSLAFTGTAVLGLISTAQAAAPGFCNQYANQAAFSAALNISNGCGYTGRRWLTDYQQHFGWCLSTSPDLAMSERFLRKAAIKACMG